MDPLLKIEKCSALLYLLIKSDITLNLKILETAIHKKSLLENIFKSPNPTQFQFVYN